MAVLCSQVDHVWVILLMYFQGNGEDTIQGQGTAKSMIPPFFSFFPAAKKQVGQVANTANNCNGEVVENVDLSLKL